MPKLIFSVSPAPDAPRDTYTVNKWDQKTVKRRVIAFNGPMIVRREADYFFGGPKSKAYVSPVMDSPTWGGMAIAAAESMKATRDFHHPFFEGFSVSGTEIIDGRKVATIHLHFGS